MKSLNKCLDKELDDGLESSFKLTIILVLISALVNVFIDDFIYCIIAAPILEESFKRYALLNFFPYKFTIFFALVEAIVYIFIFGVAVIPIRLVGITLHLTTMKIQKDFHEKDYSKTGFVCAILLHALYNFI